MIKEKIDPRIKNIESKLIEKLKEKNFEVLDTRIYTPSAGAGICGSTYRRTILATGDCRGGQAVFIDTQISLGPWGNKEELSDNLCYMVRPHDAKDNLWAMVDKAIYKRYEGKEFKPSGSILGRKLEGHIYVDEIDEEKLNKMVDTIVEAYNLYNELAEQKWKEKIEKIINELI